MIRFQIGEDFGPVDLTEPSSDVLYWNISFPRHLDCMNHRLLTNGSMDDVPITELSHFSRAC